ncbi:MAG: hypothetical protein RL616_1816 [Verrucomicrobiota bacterium]|jgi:uncharacterized repeat protein (TIGR03806 family)
MKLISQPRVWLAVPLFVVMVTLLACATKKTFANHGLVVRPAAKPFLQMPGRAEGVLPRLLSQTGAFRDPAQLTPDAALIPYDLNVPFWSDGASKARWLALPGEEKIHFAATGEWTFPRGTVFVKTFFLATNELNPQSQRRLETRLLVCDADGGVYGVTYKWRADGSDADLLATNLTENIAIKTATGTRTQAWYYPSRADCLTCHTPLAGGVLGVKTRQLNRDFAYPASVTDNQLRAWNHLGLFDTNLNEAEIKNLPSLARATDTARSLTDRARSYLDANCANCHRPRGTVAYFDARYDTPLAQQNLIAGQVLIDQGIDRARTIAPHDPWRSILFLHVNTTSAIKMPPLAHNVLDEPAVARLREWIESLPGPEVVAPPEILPGGGNFPKPVEVALRAAPGTDIRYTLDGSAPTAADLLYEKPLRIETSTVLRAKAFKPGCEKSITVQAVFVVGE